MNDGYHSHIAVAGFAAHVYGMASTDTRRMVQPEHVAGQSPCSKAHNGAPPWGLALDNVYHVAAVPM
jgi:hypothetical protein